MNKINNIIKEEIQGFLKDVNEKIEFKQQVIANYLLKDNIDLQMEKSI
jgi:hypothetical protein